MADPTVDLNAVDPQEAMLQLLTQYGTPRLDGGMVMPGNLPPGVSYSMETQTPGQMSPEMAARAAELSQQLGGLPGAPQQWQEPVSVMDKMLEMMTGQIAQAGDFPRTDYMTAVGTALVQGSKGGTTGIKEVDLANDALRKMGLTMMMPGIQRQEEWLARQKNNDAQFKMLNQASQIERRQKQNEKDRYQREVIDPIDLYNKRASAALKKLQLEGLPGQWEKQQVLLDNLKQRNEILAHQNKLATGGKPWTFTMSTMLPPMPVAVKYIDNILKGTRDYLEKNPQSSLATSILGNNIKSAIARGANLFAIPLQDKITDPDLNNIQAQMNLLRTQLRNASGQPAAAFSDLDQRTLEAAFGAFTQGDSSFYQQMQAFRNMIADKHDSILSSAVNVGGYKPAPLIGRMNIDVDAIRQRRFDRPWAFRERLSETAPERGVVGPAQGRENEYRSNDVPAAAMQQNGSGKNAPPLGTITPVPQSMPSPGPTMSRWIRNPDGSYQQAP